MNKIDRLTGEQEALISAYRKKWQDIAFSTKLINKEEVSTAIKQVYNYFFDSIKYNIEQISGRSIDCICPEKYITDASLVDFLLSIINYFYERELLEIFIGLVKHCGWIHPYKNVCLITRSPVELHLKNLELHAIAKPAIAFADGFACYAYKGIIVPDEYGKLHPNKWDSQWILKEEDVYVKSALIEGIGYDRISRELPAEIIDTSKKYGVLRLQVYDNFQFEAHDYDRKASPLQLFKMPHPKMDKTLTLRVPSDIDSIEKAIAWVDNYNYYDYDF